MLAVLEVRVNLDLDWDMLPDNDVLVAIDTETFHELPDDPRAIGYPWIEVTGIRTSACSLMDRARILRVNRLPRLTPLSRTSQRVGAPIGVRTPRRVTDNGSLSANTGLKRQIHGKH